ncbi:MAG TPA: AAA family ATPase, partial [Pyrinomonadaceae bacterium]|nr:AAA family ATPase [Pyrinomonadaceae bacterium]
LTIKRDAQVMSLSRGMKQRLCLAKTLLHDPAVLLLDEPASGLDPHARIEIRELIRELCRMGKTVLVSSHILTELADFCTSVIIMEQGHVIRSGRIEELVENLSNGLPVRIEMTDAEAAASLAEQLKSKENLCEIAVSASVIDCAFQGDRRALATLHKEIVLMHDGVVSFYERRLTIEDVFMAVGSHAVS